MGKHLEKGAEILCVGTELLLGDVVNTNAAYIGKVLAGLGISVYHHTVVGDNPERLRDCLGTAFGRADLVIMTGGLGPTFDDLTKETAAGWFGLPMVEDAEARRSIEEFFSRRNIKMSENNLKQALVPEGSTVFQNRAGSAPGIGITDGKKTAVLLPGPPREMKRMMEDSVIQYLSAFSDRVIRSHEIRMIGIGESMMEQTLRDYIDTLEGVTCAPYAKDGECMLRVTASAEDQEKAEEMMKPVVDHVLEVMKGYVYAVDEPDLEHALVHRLARERMTIATAESCTGGLISKRITDVAGSSDVFGFGLVTYANEAKMKMLGVRKETLDSVGAVSEETAREMCEGLKKLTGADIAVSVTGIAGPGGGTTEKPVGLVYIGVAGPSGTEVRRFDFSYGRYADRDRIRTVAASNALASALSCLIIK